LEWLDENGNQARPPEFMLKVAQEGQWAKIEYSTSAPANARAADIQLGLGFTAAGQIWWTDIDLREESAPPDRVVRVATVYCRPRGTTSAAESVEQFCRVVENGFRADTTSDPGGSSEATGRDLRTRSASSVRPDIICLPEGITVIGTPKSYFEVSESVPGPTTDRLGRLASQLRSYIVAGVYERTGKVVYNTAVLIDRQGKLAGKYRKTHLPREEWEAGITAGDAYPVFQTDFGKVGLMICWDVQFPEPCRAMALKGAELVLLPIWGGSEVLAKARAIENHLFLVTSSYDMKSFIVDPAGTVLGEATKDQPIALAEVHLDRQIFQPWLGDMKNRTWKERRADIPVEVRRGVEQKGTKGE
jgi:predicted amidohydrolase